MPSLLRGVSLSPLPFCGSVHLVTPSPSHHLHHSLLGCVWRVTFGAQGSEEELAGTVFTFAAGCFSLALILAFLSPMAQNSYLSMTVSSQVTCLLYFSCFLCGYCQAVVNVILHICFLRLFSLESLVGNIHCKPFFLTSAIPYTASIFPVCSPHIVSLESGCISASLSDFQL